MRLIRSFQVAMVVLAAGAPVVALPAPAGEPIAVQETRLHTPPDSHEPQRAQVDLRNAGPDALTQVTLLCTFTGAGGAVLDTQTTMVPSIAPHASVQAEAIYYGWPRASGAACRLAEPR